MSCLGVHFALATEEVAHLRSLRDSQARLFHLKEVIEVSFFENYPELNPTWRTGDVGWLEWLDFTRLGQKVCATDPVISRRVPARVAGPESSAGLARAAPF